MFGKLSLAAALSASFLFVSSPLFAADTKAEEHNHTHKTAHGGSLNAIETCETGHAEVKIDGDVFKLWFVGGGNDTLRAVRVPDTEIKLSATVDGEKESKTLVLKAKPSELAEEKAGDCSYFEGSAPWIKNAKKLTAVSAVTFKGKKRSLKIEWPAGYDPDDDDCKPASKKQ